MGERWVAEPERVGTEALPDGRLLGWAEWGPLDGVPVVFSPGAGTGRRLGFGPDVVGPLGVRLVAVDRPGLGASTPAPGRGFGDFAHDIARLAERRGLGRPAMVGNSQGAPFALACAAAGVVSALALVSAADEAAHPAVRPGLPEEFGRLVDAVLADPEGAEAGFTGFTAEAMRDMVMAGSPESDLAVYAEPGFAAAYRAALQEGFSQGAAAGYARDTVLAMARWEIALDAVAVPVDVWYGEDDRSHSPDLGATLADRIPGAVRHLVPGVGGAVLWTHAEAVLRRLLDRLGEG
ncbi:alpha/beta fold hydrolase [Streptomonospora nanhaiensis]|uniref:alpha/beta fold hydrolase n=1 Tax=Streptomonospora nanhaiensis TaxID=1323731 RepID=UPI001C99DAE1|nr:alpha/beta hydrolase [Streptomonospora nanhaiensis]MBX9390369.1 alpha/beta hydrolase [Streptomonospora nanhaiensis]